MTRGGATSATPPGGLPTLLLPNLHTGGSAQRLSPDDARTSPTSQISPASPALPRPGPTPGTCASPTLPIVPLAAGRQDDSPGSRSAPSNARAAAGSRTPMLPLLTSQPSSSRLGVSLQTPAAAASTSPTAAAVLQAGACSPSPRTPPAPLLRAGGTTTTRPVVLGTPGGALIALGASSPTRPWAPARPMPAVAASLSSPIPCPFSSASFATSMESSAAATAADGAPGSPSAAADAAAAAAAAGMSRKASAGASSPTSSSDAPAGAAGGSAAAADRARGASVDPREAAKFAALAASWWRTTDGPFAPLHALNPARVRFIRQSLAAVMGLDAEAPEPLAGLRVLDVGCGGGILSEALARLGAEVHGIDVTRENVEVARLHAGADPRVAARVRYDVISAEDLAASGTAQYDIVIASEVLEHVSRPHQLLPVLTSLLAPPPSAEGGPTGGALVVSTLNRTPASWGVAIVGAEYVTGVVPRGTHHWRKFITPEELSVMAGACGLRVWHAAGMSPLGPRMSWTLGEDLSVNYIATLIRVQQGAEGQGEGERARQQAAAAATGLDAMQADAPQGAQR